VHAHWRRQIAPQDVAEVMDDGAIALDNRDPDEHENGHILGSLDKTHGKLDMNVEGALPDLDAAIWSICNA
jgi:phage shock protein E